MSSDVPAIHNSSVRYSSYTPAQKRATQKYRANNKDKVNEQRKAYYEARKEADPEFLAYKREKAKEYYQRKKSSVPASIPDAEQLLIDMNSAYTGPMDEEPVAPMLESVIESPLDAGIESIPDVPVETPSAKVKKPRAPRKKAIVDPKASIEIPIDLLSESIPVPETPTAAKAKSKGKVKFYPPVVVESKEESPIV
jgi:hypothetical protein